MTHRALTVLLVFAMVAATGAQEPSPAPAPSTVVASMFRDRAARYAAYQEVKVVEAVRRGVGWLVAHQDDDGKFDPARFMLHDPPGGPTDGPGQPHQVYGVTGLALLALLAQGDPQHVDACRSAADWLSNQLAPSTGEPSRSVEASHDAVYGIAIGTYALVEAAAAFGVPRHREAATRMVAKLGHRRNPGAAWRYQPRDGGNDTSVTSWCLAALVEAAHIGIDVPSNDVAEALTFLDGVATPGTGHHGYSKAGEPSSRMPGAHSERFPLALGAAMTAAGMHGRLLAGADGNSPLARGAALSMLERAPSPQPQAYDLYYWFHASCAFAHMTDRAACKKWEAALHKTLLPRQRKDKAAAGSWDPTDVWGEVGGRVASTALAVLSLASPYRLERRSLFALAPDAEPCRKVRAYVAEGRIGAAIAEAERIALDDLAPPVAAAMRRFLWQADVAAKHAQAGIRLLDGATLALEAKLAICAEQAARFEGTPVGEAYVAAGRRLREDPANKRELQAIKALRPLADECERARKSKSRDARARARENLQKFAQQHAGTKAAERAAALLAELGDG